MDVRFLATFLEVSQTKHFGKAADNLYLTQSAVSARIKLLEEYFGQALFVRNRHSIQLSPAGEKLVPFAQSLQNTLIQAKEALNQAQLQHVSLASTGNAHSLFANDMLDILRRTFPEMSVRLDITNVEQMTRHLHEHTIDVGFSTQALKSDDIVSHRLGSVPLKLFSNVKMNDADQDSCYVHIEWNPKVSESFFNQTGFPKTYKLSTSTLDTALSYLMPITHNQFTSDLGSTENVTEPFCAIMPLNLGQQLSLEVVETPRTTDLNLSLDYYVHYLKNSQSASILEIIQTIKNCFLND